VTQVSDLWKPELKGKVTVLTEMRDTLGLVMLQMGIDPTKCTPDDAQKACDYMQPYVDSGQIRRFTGNDYAADLAKGNVYACMAWSGDIVQLQLDNPKLKFVFPQQGSMLWTDNMMIPKNASHPYNAHLWMNFYYQPEIAAMVEDYVNYVCPVNGAKEVLIKNDPSVANNPLIFPTQDSLDNAFVFKALTPEEELQFNQSFQALQGA
jgi:spermidine/putrescine transport system substrate-binding protein